MRLRKGEAGLSRACVVNVSQLLTIDRARLGRPLGVLSQVRLREVLQGLSCSAPIPPQQPDAAAIHRLRRKPQLRITVETAEVFGSLVHRR